MANLKQQTFDFYSDVKNSAITTGDNSIRPDDKAFHDWYRFVLSYPPHLVRDYLSDFEIDKNEILLDPFCGTGTTNLEAKLNEEASFAMHKIVELIENGLLLAVESINAWTE